MSANEMTVLDRVKVGMKVYDINGERVGKIKLVQPAASHATPDHMEFPYDLSNSAMSPSIAYRLLRTGFLYMNAALIGKDRIILPDQIDFVVGDHVHLAKKGDELYEA